MMTLVDRLLGRPLASSEEGGEKIGVLAGVPTLGLDGLSSAAYGPEAALTVLLPLGVLGLNYIGPLTGIILALLGILYLSYRQTIPAYPNGGGSFTVAKENLGVKFGLLAAAALMLDYTLNVAVGISSGIEQLVSAVPSLHHYTLTLCLIMLGILTLVNLRGVREAGALFAVPTYLFIGTLAFVMIDGLAHGLHPHPVVAPPPVSPATETVTLWLLLRAFASGCTAMTGVEAVSNGVSAFADPTIKNAQRTLAVIVGALAVLLAGIAMLCHNYHIGAIDENKAGYQSVISQVVAAVTGRGIFYYITLGATLFVLTLSANTSYAGFPRLCRLVALDDYLPHSFTLLGRRLVYTAGIAFLTGLAGLLLIAFGGITDRLIPLFAVGAFLAFTLSQAGMVLHWRKKMRDESGKQKGNSKMGVALSINALGAACTGLALAVILVAKFTHGAWITVIIIPCLVALFLGIKRHYDHVANEIACPHPLDLSSNAPPLVLIPLEGWNMATERALRYSLRLSPDVIALHVSVDEDSKNDDKKTSSEETDDLKRRWKQEVEEPVARAGLPQPRLEFVSSPYRRIVRPILDYVKALQSEYPDRIISIVVPELVETHWWEVLLHNHTATALKAALLVGGNRRIVVINVPWYLDRKTL